MSRPLETRLGRVEAKKTMIADAHASAAIRKRRIWRAQATMGAVIRGALDRTGVDAARATRLSLANEAAAALASLPDLPKSQCVDDSNAALMNDSEAVDPFALKIQAMTKCFADGKPPDFDRASFAELFAWSLAQPAAE
jgi:hypothetical protein